MCLDCGCQDIDNAHGDPAHITSTEVANLSQSGAVKRNYTCPKCGSHDVRLCNSDGDWYGTCRSCGFGGGEPDGGIDAFKDADRGVVLKAEAKKRFLLMVGYSPNRMPKRGADGCIDIAGPEVVEKACWRFMLNGAGGGTHHRPGGEGAFRVVENSVYRGPDWVMKAADGSTQTIRSGDWLIGVICSKETWAEYESGVFGGGSLQGGCGRGPVTAETLARQRSA